MFTSSRLLAIVVAAIVCSSGTSHSSIQYEASAGYNIAGGGAGGPLHQSFTPPLTAFLGDFGRFGAACPPPGTPDYLCARANGEVALVGPPTGGGLLTLRAEARLTRHDGASFFGNEEIVYAGARITLGPLGTIATPSSGFVVLNFGLSGIASATTSSASVFPQAFGQATLYADRQVAIQCTGYPCPGIPIHFDAANPNAWKFSDGFGIDLRADTRDKPAFGLTGFDAELIADFHDTLALLSIEVQDDNHQTVPGASLFVENYDGNGTTLTISNEPPPPPSTTTTNPEQTTSTVPGSETSTTTVPRTDTSTTSTTTMLPGPTTTTTAALQDVCDREPDGPTFTSIGCRLDALLGRIARETSLGDYQQKLPQPLAGAVARLEQAEQACRAGDAKRAKKGIKKADRSLAQYAHTLRGRRARKRLRDAAQREDLVTRGNAIRASVTTLRSVLRCPDDAPAQAR